MLITKSTFKIWHLYKINLVNHYYYSIVTNLGDNTVDITDLSTSELALGQAFEGDCNISYGKDNSIVDIEEIGPILSYGEQIKLNYPELLI